ncbi:hypothetical protein BJ742DRAFT_804221 [Cladochytrium replicatum]|nr:hypothetical protein BJ742DRAFT_804221 [Cladochytrium replicatum]
MSLNSDPTDINEAHDDPAAALILRYFQAHNAFRRGKYETTLKRLLECRNILDTSDILLQDPSVLSTEAVSALNRLSFHLKYWFNNIGCLNARYGRYSVAALCLSRSLKINANHLSWMKKQPQIDGDSHLLENGTSSDTGESRVDIRTEVLCNAGIQFLYGDQPESAFTCFKEVAMALDTRSPVSRHSPMAGVQSSLLWLRFAESSVRHFALSQGSTSPQRISVGNFDLFVCPTEQPLLKNATPVRPFSSWDSPSLPNAVACFQRCILHVFSELQSSTTTIDSYDPDLNEVLSYLADRRVQKHPVAVFAMTGWSYCAIKLEDFSTALKLARTAAGDLADDLSDPSDKQTMSDSGSDSDEGERIQPTDGWEHSIELRQPDSLDYTRLLARLYAVYALLSLNKTEEALDEVSRLESDVFAELVSHRGQSDNVRRRTLTQLAHAAALCIGSGTKWEAQPFGSGARDENVPSFLGSLQKAEAIIGEAISKEKSRAHVGVVKPLDEILSQCTSSLKAWIHLAKGEETLAVEALMHRSI